MEWMEGEREGWGEGKGGGERRGMKGGEGILVWYVLCE